MTPDLVVNSNKCIIFDIDGCLADCDHRLHLLAGSKPDWESFFSAVGGDAPISHNLWLLKVLYSSGAYIALCTGRPERTRDMTVTWFSQNHIVMGHGYDSILMRKDGDYRPDYEAKREMLQQLRALNMEVIMAFDDRQGVVDMFIEEGVPCHLIRAPDAKKMEDVKKYEKEAESSGEASTSEAEAQCSC